MAITLTPVLDDGAPRVEIVVDDLEPGGQMVTVDWSVNEGRTWTAVHEAENIGAFGGLFARDYLAPLNVQTTYRVTALSGDPLTGNTASVLVPSEYAWISDPLKPRVAIPVSYVQRQRGGLMLLSPSAGSYVRRQVGHAARPPMGGHLAPVSVGPRLAPEGIDLHLRALIDSQAALVNDIAELIGDDGNGGTFALRGLPADIGLSPVAHVWAPTIQDSPVVGGMLGSRRDWIMTVDQIAPPANEIQIPWWSYAQVRDEWDGFTYAQVMAARPGATYLDWLRDPTRP